MDAIMKKIRDIRHSIDELGEAFIEYKGQGDKNIKFSYKRFINEKIAVWCETKEDSKIFTAYLMGRGCKWEDGDCLTAHFRERHGSQTCYLSSGGIFDAGKAWCESEGYKIVKFSLHMLAEADDD